MRERCGKGDHGQADRRGEGSKEAWRRNEGGPTGACASPARRTVAHFPPPACSSMMSLFDLSLPRLCAGDSRVVDSAEENMSGSRGFAFLVFAAAALLGLCPGCGPAGRGAPGAGQDTPKSVGTQPAGKTITIGM